MTVLQAGIEHKADLASVEAEMALLGAVLSNNAVWGDVSHIVGPDDFFVGIHGQIYANAGRYIEGGSEANEITLGAYFDESDFPQPNYLRRLVISTITVTNAVEYARTVRMYSMARAVRVNCATWSDDAMRPGRLPDIAREMAALMESINDQSEAKRKPASAAQVAGEAMRQAEDMRRVRETGERSPLITTGLPSLDRHLGGFRPGELIIVAGSTSMGKSALALGLVRSAARDGRRCGIFSLEMSNLQIGQRWLSMECDVPVWRIRDGIIDQSDAEFMDAASARISEWPIEVDDNAGTGIAEMSIRAQAWKHRGGLDLILVDYLQLMTSPVAGRGSNRVEEVSAITRGLKNLAKDLGVPVIALSQLNRGVDNRDNKRPMMSDLRESGSIEQDADAILFCYREAYYSGRNAPSKSDPSYRQWRAEQDEAERHAELIIGKQRQGSRGDFVAVGWDGPKTMFYDNAAG